MSNPRITGNLVWDRKQENWTSIYLYECLPVDGIIACKSWVNLVVYHPFNDVFEMFFKRLVGGMGKLEGDIHEAKVRNSERCFFVFDDKVRIVVILAVRVNSSSGLSGLFLGFFVRVVLELGERLKPFLAVDFLLFRVGSGVS